MHMRNLALVIIAYCLFASSVAAQKDAPALPTVTEFKCPYYPGTAQHERIQGPVKMQVTTDGHRVTAVKLISGHPELAPDAIKNVRTWKFADHSPTTFEVTYSYVYQVRIKHDPGAKCSAKMELPTRVTVGTMP
jgi:hypothetical protein